MSGTARTHRTDRSWLRWAVRLLAVAAGLAIIVPSARTLVDARRPMPLPSSTWSLPASAVVVRAPGARGVPQATALPQRLNPLTVYVPELGIVLPFTDAGESDGWLQIGHEITSGVHFADGSTLVRGTFLVAAHVNSRDLSLSPFAKLWQIQAGTLVVVSDANGAPHRFKTTALDYYDKDHLPAVLWNPQGPSAVALVTCGGKLTVSADGRRHYADNVVVMAYPA